jgi:hypothetical protein
MRRRILQDQRLDWRDPKMPVLREYHFVGETKTIIDPDYESRYRAYCMEQPGDDWRYDPTYNMRRKK